LKVRRWSIERPTAIRPVWRVIGLILWTLVALLVMLALASKANPFGLASLRADVAGEWTTLLSQSRAHGQAPDLTLQLFDGGTFRLADQRGKVVVVNFWASWCPPCRAEAPRFVAASQKYRDRGVVFVGIDINDTPDNARAFLREFGITYANGTDQDLTITEAYGVAGLPTTFVVDGQGKLRQRWEGEIKAEQLSGFVEEALR
jgi:cytochrome c biogenesis protein CcmG, thiol:disulfide interchange protein DsbE